MKKFLTKFLLTTLFIVASFTLITACDDSSGESSGDTPPTETVYTKTFTNKDDTYTYKITTDGNFGTLALYDGSETQLLLLHAQNVQDGTFIFEENGWGYEISATVSGETFEFDGLSNHPGIVMPYASVAGTYSLLNYNGTVLEQTAIFNDDGTGQINDGSNSTPFEYYTLEGNRAIMYSNDLVGDYIEFTEQGLKYLGDVYAPSDYVYFSSNVIDSNLPYEVLSSDYGAEHLGVVGSSTLYFNENGAYRVDRGSYKYDETEEYVEVENIFFGKTVFNGDEFTFTCQSKDGYGYEMEKSIENDKHYVTVRYEKISGPYGEPRFDYEHTAITKENAVWNDYYFGKSYYLYKSTDDSVYGASGDTKDYEDGYKTLKFVEEIEWGTGKETLIYHYVVMPNTLELKYIFIEYGISHYEGLYGETLLTRKGVNGVVPEYTAMRLLLKTKDGFESESNAGYIYQKVDEKTYEKIGAWLNNGEDSLISYNGIPNDPVNSHYEGYCYIDKENSTYTEIGCSSGRNLDNDLYTANYYNQEPTFYDADENEIIYYEGVVVYDYDEGRRAYLFIYAFDEPNVRVSVDSYDCTYSYTEKSDGDEMTFIYAWEEGTTTIVIKLSTGEQKKIVSINHNHIYN